MDRTPVLSIVVPTRNRADTLQHCLATIVGQKGVSDDDYEIVVSDNNSSPETRQVVESFDAPTLRYVRSDRDLCMAHNYEFGVSQARGDYVLAVGDDDGVLAYAVRHLLSLIRDHDRPPAIHWRRALYTWPTIASPGDANFLSIPATRYKTIDNGRAMLRRAAAGEIGADSLPMINCSIIRRDLIDKHKHRVGRMFVNPNADVYTGYAFAYLAEEYISLSTTFTVAGLSRHSTGVATLMRTDKGEIYRETVDLNRDAGMATHPQAPDIDIPTAHPADCFLCAKELLFPDDDTLQLDRKAWTLRHLAAIPHTDPQDRAYVRGRIRASLDDSPALLDWFDRDAPELPPSPRPRLRPSRFGFNHENLTVDASLFGVQNIQQAVELADRILSFGEEELVYEPNPQETIAWHRADSEAKVRESLAEHIAWHRADAEAQLLKRLNVV